MSCRVAVSYSHCPTIYGPGLHLRRNPVCVFMRASAGPYLHNTAARFAFKGFGADPRGSNPSVLIVFRSNAGLAENAIQGVNTAVLSPVLFNYLAKAVVPAAHG